MQSTTLTSPYTVPVSVLKLFTGEINHSNPTLPPGLHRPVRMHLPNFPQLPAQPSAPPPAVLLLRSPT